MKKYCIIYKATNKINGKSYIGQTINGLNKRKYNHEKESEYNNTSNVFHNAIRKYGNDAFEWEIISKGFPYLFIDIFEMYWINYYNTYEGDGYNMTKGGNKPPRLCGEQNGFFNRSHSEESIKKMLNTRSSNKEWLEKIQNKSEEHKRKISESNKLIRTDDWKSTIGKKAVSKREKTLKERGIDFKGKNNPMYGVKRTEDWKENQKERIKNEKPILCNHCQRKIDIRNYSRWHGKNCKLNDDFWEEW